jgi:hypothetical protein
MNAITNSFQSLTCPVPSIAVLVGSRALNTETPNSDWDIAIWWLDADDAWTNLGKTELLRRNLAKAMNSTEDNIDLIDIQQAGLAMREKIANEGQLIYAQKPLAWMKFLTRTWWEVEQFYWEQQHAINV